MKDEQMQQNMEDRHGKAEEALLLRLRELGFLAEECLDKECEMCDNAVCKGKE